MRACASVRVSSNDIGDACESVSDAFLVALPLRDQRVECGSRFSAKNVEHHRAQNNCVGPLIGARTRAHVISWDALRSPHRFAKSARSMHEGDTA